MKNYVWVVERFDPISKKWAIWASYLSRSDAREESKWSKQGDYSVGVQSKYRTRRYYSEDSFIGMFR